MNEEGYKIIEKLRELFERGEEVVPEGYVKVVRCGECKYAKKTSLPWLGSDFYCLSCELLCDCDEDKSHSIPMRENDYCSRGVRKEETEC